MTPLVDRLAIAGVGLVGGSLGLAVREAGLAREVVGFGRGAENLEIARRRGLVDRATRDAAEAVRDADVVVLAAPLGACAALAATLRPHARRGAVLTDVGSAKAEIVPALERAWAGVGPVVGGHPIAGSETSGAAAARADLFRGHRCILTPTTTTDRAALARVRALWEGVGARVEETSPEAHDRILAYVSHLPHLVAYALAAMAGDATVEGRAALDWAGTGFRDTTRIAGSPPALWRDVALANAAAVGAALDAFRAALEEIEGRLAAGDGPGLEATLARGRDARRRLDRS
jgi:prephenate dehydrogenase